MDTNNTLPSLATLLQRADNAVRDQLFHSGTQQAIEDAYQAILSHPANKMSLDVLRYRTRSLFY